MKLESRRGWSYRSANSGSIRDRVSGNPGTTGRYLVQNTLAGEAAQRVPYSFMEHMVLILVSMSGAYYAGDVGLNLVGGSSRYLFMFGLASFLMALMVGSGKRGGIRLSAETLLMVLWWLWTMLLINTFQSAQFGNRAFPPVMRSTTFSLAVFLICSGSLARIRSEVVVKGLVISAALLALVAVGIGDVRQSLGSSGYRLGQLTTGNSNDFAYRILFGVMGIAYLYQGGSRRSTKLWSVAGVVVFTALIGLTGSRKAFIAEVLFLAIYFVLQYASARKMRRNSAMVTLVGLLLVGIGMQFVVTKTQMGERLKAGLEVERQATTTEERMDGRARFYVMASVLFVENPFVGVGLGRFGDAARTQMASHSDYISIAVGTGSIGFLLYFGAYFLILLRLQRAVGQTVLPTRRLQAQLMQSMLLMVLITALGRWNYDNALTWAALGAAAAFVREESVKTISTTPNEKMDSAATHFKRRVPVRSGLNGSR